MIPLFQIPFKAGLRQAPVQLICQGVNVENELLLWVDGVNAQDPVVIPLSAVPASRLLTDFESYMEAHRDVARRVLMVASGEISPTIAARAVQAMLMDPGLDAQAAVDMVNEQALDLIDADQQSQAYFWGAGGPITTGGARGAALAA